MSSCVTADFTVLIQELLHLTHEDMIADFTVLIQTLLHLTHEDMTAHFTVLIQALLHLTAVMSSCVKCRSACIKTVK
jgi:hypothetical protein